MLKKLTGLHYIQQEMEINRKRYGINRKRNGINWTSSDPTRNRIPFLVGSEEVLLIFLEYWFISMLLTGWKWIYYLNVTDYCCFLFLFFFFEKKLFAQWILFTLSSLPGIFEFDILFLNILFLLVGIIPYSGFTGLNNISYIYIYIYIFQKELVN